jgi:hypothetical protein
MSLTFFRLESILAVAMSRPKGTPNKETAARRAAYDRLLAVYQDKLAKDVIQKAVAEMLVLADKYHPAGETPDETQFTRYIKLARAFASDILDTQTPRLSAVRVGGDRENPLMINDGRTSIEVREQLENLISQGWRPSKVGVLKPPVTIEGVANRVGKNGGG